MGLGSRLGKILIANRGEIACRVIRSAKRFGVKTVAVYSDADVNSMHVQMADEAYNIGRAAAQESYLKGKKIIDVAKKSGALAIHPGYGFLSENAEFASLCKESNIIFIGPPPSAIRDMGIKSTSKSIMMAAGVAVIPGYHGEDQSEIKLKEEAIKIGFPLMIKAVRGGGGKGMRIVNAESEFEGALDSARRESLRSFGDDAVLLERYVSRPRHIEVQIFGDNHGNYVHLFERDCSIQRRHQKVIEQAPAPGVGEALRNKLGDAAVRAAKAVNYVGAGTVEFIMDTDTNEFYFMEMNTRLQVEHAVTEMITGLDLVEWQLRVASGERIPVEQQDIKLSGHSVEARIYAEDTYRGFIPTAGRIHELALPLSSDVRVETGVTRGDNVSVHYDPMIAKLVVWDQDAEAALDKLETALSNFNIVGVENNVDFLRRLCKNNNLREGNVHTGFIEENKETLLTLKPSEIIIAKAALSILLNDELIETKGRLGSSDPFSPFTFANAFRLNHRHIRNLKFKHLDQDFPVTVSYEPHESFGIKIGEGEFFYVKGKQIKENNFFYLTMETSEFLTTTKLALNNNEIYIFDQSGDFKIVMSRDLEWEEGGNLGKKGQEAVSPMPGVVEKINVKPEDIVKKGDPIAVVMAMKMEHIIRAEQDGIVESVFFKTGDNIGKNIALVKFRKEKVDV